MSLNDFLLGILLVVVGSVLSEKTLLLIRKLKDQAKKKKDSHLPK